jgi:hypothetical protein
VEEPPPDEEPEEEGSLELPLPLGPEFGGGKVPDEEPPPGVVALPPPVGSGGPGFPGIEGAVPKPAFHGFVCPLENCSLSHIQNSKKAISPCSCAGVSASKRKGSLC